MSNTLNDYDFPIASPAELPDEPDKLFVEAQLEAAVAEVTGCDDVTVTSRFSRSVVRAEIENATDEAVSITVSWDVFEDENRYEPGVGGWVVLCSSLANLGLLD